MGSELHIKFPVCSFVSAICRRHQHCVQVVHVPILFDERSLPPLIICIFHQGSAEDLQLLDLDGGSLQGEEIEDLVQLIRGGEGQGADHPDKVAKVVNLLVFS